MYSASASLKNCEGDPRRTRGDGAKRLNRDDVLVTRTVGTDLCRLDVVQLLDRTSRIPRSFVSLGQFVPYTKPKAG